MLTCTRERTASPFRGSVAFFQFLGRTFGLGFFFVSFGLLRMSIFRSCRYLGQSELISVWVVPHGFS
ncbi:uncharacterized protein GLRG_03485, partial [Colletotrichum graminicola M1.001]